jgi:hypothetical protein
MREKSPASCSHLPFAIFVSGNVAQDLREWCEAAGYNVDITGGGRIDYDLEEGRAVVCGFSYGFGKGDHQRAASLITEWTLGEIVATYDNSDGLY